MDAKWWQTTKSAMGLKGRRVVETLDVSWSLIGSVRQEGNTGYGDLVWRAHEGEYVPADTDTLNSRREPGLNSAERQLFRDATLLYQTKAEVREANLSRMVAGYGREFPRVAHVPAMHNTPTAAKAGDEHAKGLQRKAWYVVGAPHMLTSNRWTRAGLTNGLMGELVDLVCEQDPWENCPSVALLAVDAGTLPKGSGLHCADEQLAAQKWGREPCAGIMADAGAGPWQACPGWQSCPNGLAAHAARKIIVPIPCITREWSAMRGGTLQRTMLPLRLAIAITIHKSQGMAIPRVKVNLGDSEKHAGGTFTALSRVPCLTGICLEKMINHDRLTKVNASRALGQRKGFEMQHWPPRTAAAVEHFRGMLRTLRPAAAGGGSDSAAALAELAVELLGLDMFAEGAAAGSW